MFRKFFTLIATGGVLVGGVALIMFMGALRPKIETQEPVITAPPVFYAVATAQPVTLDVTTQGEVRPRTDISLTSQVSGRIERTSNAFVDGGAFDKGELLIKIEDADYKLQVTSAKARVAQAQEVLSREQAESDLASQDFEELGLGGDASDLTLRKPQLAQARANFEAARADQRAAQLNLDRTAISAPFQGRVRQRLAGPGQFVSPGAQLGTIFSTDVVEIRLPLTDNDLAKLGLPIAFFETEDNPGPPVALSAVIAGEPHAWTGRIARTDGAINPATRQVSAIAVVDDPYGESADDGTPLAVGLYVDARIEGRPYEGAFTLPRSALYGADIVYVIKTDDTLAQRNVQVVASSRDTVTITSGVSDGERVVTSPLRGAGNGDKVLPIDPNSNTGSRTSDEDAAIAESIDDAATAEEAAEAVQGRG